MKPRASDPGFVVDGVATVPADGPFYGVLNGVEYADREAFDRAVEALPPDQRGAYNVASRGSATEPYVLARKPEAPTPLTLDHWVSMWLHGSPHFAPMPADHMGPHAARPDPAMQPMGEFWQSLDLPGRPLFVVAPRLGDSAAVWVPCDPALSNPPLGPVAGQSRRAWLASVVAFLCDEKKIPVPDALRAAVEQLRGDPGPAPAKPKQRRGFACMTPEQQRAIASKGGKASHAQGRGHEWTSAEATAAGRRGGAASRGGRGKTGPT